MDRTIDGPHFQICLAHKKFINIYMFISTILYSVNDLYKLVGVCICLSKSRRSLNPENKT